MYTEYILYWYPKDPEGENLRNEAFVKIYLVCIAHLPLPKSNEFL